MNPFIAFARDPVTVSALAAYALLVIAVLLATMYILTRNLMTLYTDWRDSAWTLPTGPWFARAVAVPVILAVDALLFGALVWIVTL